MNLSIQTIVDPIIKLSTWLLVLASWTILCSSEIYKQTKTTEIPELSIPSNILPPDAVEKLFESSKSVIPFSDVVFLSCSYFIFSTILLGFSIIFFFKGRSLVLGSDLLFGINFTGTSIFGVFMFHGGVRLVEFYNAYDSVIEVVVKIVKNSKFIHVDDRIIDASIDELGLEPINTTAVFMIMAGIVSILDVLYQAFRRFFQK